MSFFVEALAASRTRVKPSSTVFHLFASGARRGVPEFADVAFHIVDARMQTTRLRAL